MCSTQERLPYQLNYTLEQSPLLCAVPMDVAEWVLGDGLRVHEGDWSADLCPAQIKLPEQHTETICSAVCCV
jgi:hypothetical protein